MSALAVIIRGIAVVVLVLLAACRPGEGQRCVCEGECRRGLVCAQGGRQLEERECVDAGDRTPGECIYPEADDLSDMVPDEDGIFSDIVYHDVGGKRDFEPGLPPEDDGEMESSSTSSTSTGNATTTGDATTTGAPSTTSTSGATSSSSSGAQ
jgi:hypothetical protein